jgi:hypothetical protein
MRDMSVTKEMCQSGQVLASRGYATHVFRVWSSTDSPLGGKLSSLISPMTYEPLKQEPLVISIDPKTTDPALLQVGFPQHLSGHLFSHMIKLQGTRTDSNSGWGCVCKRALEELEITLRRQRRADHGWWKLFYWRC